LKGPKEKMPKMPKLEVCTQWHGRFDVKIERSDTLILGLGIRSRMLTWPCLLFPSLKPSALHKQWCPGRPFWSAFCENTNFDLIFSQKGMEHGDSVDSVFDGGGCIHKPRDTWNGFICYNVE
jgi:hypothetical protein